MHPKTSANEADDIFEVDFGKQKIELLNSFTDRKIEVLRQINPTSSSSSSDHGGGGGSGGGAGKGSSRVTDQHKKFSCPLSATKHQSGTRPVRPFFVSMPSVSEYGRS